MIIEVTDATFEDEVLNSHMPTILDFSATWCGPCKKQLEVLVKYAEENKGKVKVCKIDADANPSTMSQFKVKGLPTILLFIDGTSVASKVGLVNLSSLQKFVTDNQ